MTNPEAFPSYRLYELMGRVDLGTAPAAETAKEMFGLLDDKANTMDTRTRMVHAYGIALTFDGRRDDLRDQALQRYTASSAELAAQKPKEALTLMYAEAKLARDHPQVAGTILDVLSVVEAKAMNSSAYTDRLRQELGSTSHAVLPPASSPRN